MMAPDYNREALASILSREQTGEFFAPLASGQGDHKQFDPCRSGQGGGSPDPVILFDAATHYTWLNRQWVRGSGWLPDTIDDRIYLTIKLDGLVRHDRENPNATPVADYSIRHYFGDIIAGRTDIADKKKVVLDGFTEGEKNFPVQLALVMKDGAAFGGIVEMTAGKALYELPLSALRRVKAVLLPRPYPTFLPYYSDAGEATTLDLLQIESLQISIGPGIPENKLNAGFELKIRQVSLE